MWACKSSTVAASRSTPCSCTMVAGGFAVAPGVPARAETTASAAATRTIANRTERRIFHLQWVWATSLSDHFYRPAAALATRWYRGSTALQVLDEVVLLLRGQAELEAAVVVVDADRGRWDGLVARCGTE